MPCCWRQQQREPLIHPVCKPGRTAIDLNSYVGSLLVVTLGFFASFHTDEEGYPLETSIDDKCFFSSELMVWL